MPEGTKTGDEGKTGGEGGEKTPEVKTPPAPEKEPAKAKDSEGKPPAPEKKEAGGEKDPKATAHQVSDDDEIPETADLLQMSKAALNKRLTRHTKKELRDRFGSDDLDKIKADLDELKTLREEKENARRAQLSEIARAKEDASKEKKRADDAETKLREQVDAQTFAEYDRDASEILEKHIAPKHMKRLLKEFKEHVLTLDDAELEPKKFKKVTDAWAKKFVEENPEFARPTEEPKKISLSTGSNPQKQEKGKPDLAHKVATPGKVNTMSRAEYLQHKRERGLA